jgi:hypothetical protein
VAPCTEASHDLVSFGVALRGGMRFRDVSPNLTVSCPASFGYRDAIGLLNGLVAVSELPFNFCSAPQIFVDR